MAKLSKTLTALLIVILILLVSGTVVSFYLYQKEFQLRTSAETELKKVQEVEMKLQGELASAKKQVALLEDQNKDIEEKLESSMSDLEVEQGLKEKIKQENDSLKESMEKESQKAEKLRLDLSKELEVIQKKLVSEQEHSKQLETQMQEFANKNSELEGRLSQTQSQLLKDEDAPVAAAVEPAPPVDDVSSSNPNSGIELPKIVVNPNETNPKGRILSVDQDTEFVIFDLGVQDGVKQGDMMSIYRGQDYLGDIKVTRVQDKMSAADLVPPISSRTIRKNDLVVLKQ